MKELPPIPDLGHLRREARVLKSRHRARDEQICKVIGHFDTSMHGLSPDAIFARKFSILDAQRVTARLYSFSSWTRLKLFVDKSTRITDERNPSLRDQLLKRQQAGSALLKRARKKKWKHGTKEPFLAFNQASGEIIQEIYDQYGWPGPNIVGKDGTEACSWLALNNVYDSEFQHLTAELLRDAMTKGECYAGQYASVKDRCLALTYEPTLYGTSPEFNTETGRVEYCARHVVDKNNLEKRRAEVGLDNSDEYNRIFVEEWSRGNFETDRAKWENYKRKTALKGGYIKN